MTKTVYSSDMLHEAVSAGNNRENFFSFASKDLPPEETRYYDNNKFGHLWTGEDAEFAGKPLIKGRTIVAGMTNDPIIIQPDEFMKKYQFTEYDPLSSGPNNMEKISQQKDDLCRIALDKIKKTIRSAGYFASEQEKVSVNDVVKQPQEKNITYSTETYTTGDNYVVSPTGSHAPKIGGISPEAAARVAMKNAGYGK